MDKIEAEGEEEEEEGGRENEEKREGEEITAGRGADKGRIRAASKRVGVSESG
jgi:hypothetical protein